MSASITMASASRKQDDLLRKSCGVMDLVEHTDWYQTMKEHRQKREQDLNTELAFLARGKSTRMSEKVEANPDEKNEDGRNGHPAQVDKLVSLGDVKVSCEKSSGEEVEGRVAALEELLAQKDAAIAELKTLLARQDAVIADRDAQLARHCRAVI